MYVCMYIRLHHSSAMNRVCSSSQDRGLIRKPAAMVPVVHTTPPRPQRQLYSSERSPTVEKVSSRSTEFASAPGASSKRKILTDSDDEGTRKRYRTKEQRRDDKRARVRGSSKRGREASHVRL